MSSIICRTTKFALSIAKQYISEGDVLIDATCGGGRDTLFLAKLSPSKLYAFDIQEEAVDKTRNLLSENGFSGQLHDGTIDIICDSHINMSEYVNEPVSVIIFNLGYLPGGDRGITTCVSDTLKAVEEGAALLKKDGLICITMYPGHEEGRREKESLLSFASELDPKKYHCAYIGMINQPKNPPEILLITLRANG